MQGSRSHLICEFADPRPEDGIHFEAGHLLGVLCDDVAELQPELVLALALQRPEAVVIHQLRHLLGRLTPLFLQRRGDSGAMISDWGSAGISGSQT